MDKDRVKGEAKQAESAAQQKWGEAKDKARDLWENGQDEAEDIDDAVEDPWDEREQRDAERAWRSA